MLLLEGILKDLEVPERSGDVGGPIFDALINAYGSRGQLEKAIETFHNIVGPTGVKCLRSVLFHCRVATPPRWEDALEILHSSHVAGSDHGRGRVDQIALSHTVIALSRADQWEQALNVLDLYGTESER